MSSQNQLSRWGAISRNIPELAPGAKVFLVADSDDTSDGSNPGNLGADFPVDEDGVARVFTTIQAASNAAVAGRGDVVLVAPGYDHSLARADSWTTAGVQVIGMGNGLNRSTIRYTVATDRVDLAADNIRVSNIQFLSAVDSCALALDMDSGTAGQRVDNCLFNFSATGNDFRVMIRAGASESVIEDNHFLAEDTAGGGSAIRILGGYPDNTVIRRNMFVGQWDSLGDTNDCSTTIMNDTGYDSTDSNLVGMVIDNNIFVLGDTITAVAVRLPGVGGGTATRNCIISNNVFAVFDCATADTTQFLPGSFLPINNLMKRSDTTEKLVSDSFVVV